MQNTSRHVASYNKNLLRPSEYNCSKNITQRKTHAAHQNKVVECGVTVEHISNCDVLPWSVPHAKL